MGMLGIRTEVDCSVEPSMTKQSFRDEVDINKIVAKFERTGMITHLQKSTPFYGDVSALVGYQDALNVVNEAELLFSSMSAEVRERFANDPAKMIEFLSDERNVDEAVKLGLVVRRPEPVKAEPVPEPVRKKGKAVEEPPGD